MIFAKKCNPMNEFGLSEKSMKIISGIYEKYPSVLEVVVYGSRAKGNFREGSDIDMTIKGTPDFSHEDLLKINNDFYESELPYLVDISDYSKLQNPDLIEHIDRAGKILYRRKN